ncbi:AAA family ATPase [bacterium]|nr:AAA family ATPase [bacterium]
MNTISPAPIFLSQPLFTASPLRPNLSKPDLATDMVSIGTTAFVAEPQPQPVVTAAQADDSVWIPGSTHRLVETPSTLALMSKVVEAIVLNDAVLLTGGTGAGKTAVIKHLAAVNPAAPDASGYPLRRVNLDGNSDEVSLFGGYKPGPEGGFRWVDGVVTEAIRKGQWLLLDEINLADPAVLERINPLLDGDGYLVLTEKEDQEKVQVSPDCRIFATMNPASYAGRKELSAAMFNRFRRKVWVDALPPGENCEVLAARLPQFGREDLMALCNFHAAISKASEERTLGKKGGPYPFTLRDLLKVARRVESSQKRHPEMNVRQHMWLACRDLYQARFMQDEDRQAVELLLKATLGAANQPSQSSPGRIQRSGSQVAFGESSLPRRVSRSPFVPDLGKAAMPETSANCGRMEQLARAVEHDEPVLLVGPTAAGKTSRIRWAAAETGNEFRRVNLSNYTDTQQLIGGYFPAIDPQTKKPVAGKFEWRDGVVVEAMKKGQWLVLDEVNLADPAVLEKLNSLLDPDRALVLDEHEGEKVVAHPDFRVFATMNPPTAEYGGRKELSPAMRNRFTEIWTPAVTDAQEEAEIVSAWLEPLQLIEPNGRTVDKQSLANQLVAFHDQVRAMAERGPDGRAPELTTAKKDGYQAYTLRDLKGLVDYIGGLLGQKGPDPAGGTGLVERDLGYVFRGGAMAYYGEGLRNPEDREKIARLASEKANQL